MNSYRDEYRPFLFNHIACLYDISQPTLYLLGVVYPMQSRTRPRRNLWAYLLPVLILAIGFNIPKALEFRVVQVSTFVLCWSVFLMSSGSGIHFDVNLKKY